MKVSDLVPFLAVLGLSMFITISIGKQFGKVEEMENSAVQRDESYLEGYYDATGVNSPPKYRCRADVTSKMLADALRRSQPVWHLCSFTSRGELPPLFRKPE